MPMATVISLYLSAALSAGWMGFSPWGASSLGNSGNATVMAHPPGACWCTALTLTLTLPHLETPPWANFDLPRVS